MLGISMLSSISVGGTSNLSPLDFAGKNIITLTFTNFPKKPNNLGGRGRPVLLRIMRFSGNQSDLPASYVQNVVTPLKNNSRIKFNRSLLESYSTMLFV